MATRSDGSTSTLANVSFAQAMIPGGVVPGPPSTVRISFGTPGVAAIQRP